MYIAFWHMRVEIWKGLLMNTSSDRHGGFLIQYFFQLCDFKLDFMNDWSYVIGL